MARSNLLPVLLTVLATFALTTAANAEAPNLINYQGMLNDSEGNPVADASYDITFTIYRLDGISVWTSGVRPVQVTNGLFTYLLGTNVPLPLDVMSTQFTRYLGIKVGADPEMVPRTQLVSSPYAYKVATIHGATGGTIEGTVEIGSTFSFDPDLGILRLGTVADGYNFPSTDGVADQVLSSNGSGQLGWTTASGSNWTLLDSVLYTNNYWGIARGGADNMLHGDSAHTHVNLGVACTTGTSGLSRFAATVSGGDDNTAAAERSTVGGGNLNVASGRSSTISGGQKNVASGVYSAIGGGSTNTASSTFATVCGGQLNVASNINATVGGGLWNTASGQRSTVSGGVNNNAAGHQSTVGGGQYNMARGMYSTVAGGGGATEADSNLALGDYSTTEGGSRNIVDGNYATIPGGYDNSATGNYSFAAGRRARADNHGCFVWADSDDQDFPSLADNQFLVRATGGTRIYSHSSLGTGVFLPPGSGAWLSVSDSTTKENIRSVDGNEILEKLSQLEISRWNYETQNPTISHIGPMAQDFYRLFKVGDDNKTISTIDPDGIALVAIKELLEKIETLEERIMELEARND